MSTRIIRGTRRRRFQWVGPSCLFWFGLFWFGLFWFGPVRVRDVR